MVFESFLNPPAMLPLCRVVVLALLGYAFPFFLNKISSILSDGSERVTELGSFPSGPSHAPCLNFLFSW